MRVQSACTLSGQSSVQLSTQPKTATAADIPVRSIIAGQQKLHISASWLEKQRRQLTVDQQNLLNVALDALNKNEAIENIQCSPQGVTITLARARYDAVNLTYQRDASAPERLGFLSIGDCKGNTLLQLGTQHQTISMPAAESCVPCQANEASILAHSRYDPLASWQNALFIVPFFTADGKKTKVVGDYQKGDTQSFGVQNEQGESYAMLKRTRLDNGEQVWMLPEYASISGGADNTLASSTVHNTFSALSHDDFRAEAAAMYNKIVAMDNEEKFGDRDIDDHLDILEQIVSDTEIIPSLAALPEYNIKMTRQGETVGLLSVTVDMKNKDGATDADKQLILWVDKIAAFPGTKGNGTALLEKAITIAEQANLGCTLRAFVQMSHAFYNARDFKVVDAQIRELDPEASTHWEKDDSNVWRFQRSS